jgi:hypothetical protein
MTQEKKNVKDKPHILRKKIKRIDESREALQEKNREKAKAIKAYQDAKRRKKKMMS